MSELTAEALSLAEWICDNPSKVLTMDGSRELYRRLAELDARHVRETGCEGLVEHIDVLATDMEYIDLALDIDDAEWDQMRTHIRQARAALIATRGPRA